MTHSEGENALNSYNCVAPAVGPNANPTPCRAEGTASSQGGTVDGLMNIFGHTEALQWPGMATGRGHPRHEAGGRVVTLAPRPGYDHGLYHGLHHDVTEGPTTGPEPPRWAANTPDADPPSEDLPGSLEDQPWELWDELPPAEEVQQQQQPWVAPVDRRATDAPTTLTLAQQASRFHIHHQVAGRCAAPMGAELCMSGSSGSALATARHTPDAKPDVRAEALHLVQAHGQTDEEPRTPPTLPQPAGATLPTSQDGRPKPAPAWIAGALYYMANQEYFAELVGITVTEAGSGPAKSVHFRFKDLKANGKPIASMLREILRLAGSEVALPGWDAVRKHLSGKNKWWENPCRGGNRGGDFTQTYRECTPGIFKLQMQALLRTRPGLVQEAMQNWLHAWAQINLDSLAALPPVDPPEQGSRKRERKEIWNPQANGTQCGGKAKETTRKKRKEWDEADANNQLPRTQQAAGPVAPALTLI